MKKQLANIITISRIVAALLLAFTRPYSNVFRLLYCYSGISDLMDGYLARKNHLVSRLGALLDSVADAIFMAVVLSLLVPTVIGLIPKWMVWWAGMIGMIRVGGYLLGFIKYRTWASLHTNFNKLTGLLLFLAPLLSDISGIFLTGIMIGSVATAAAIEELVLIIKKPELNRDIRGCLGGYRAMKTMIENKRRKE